MKLTPGECVVALPDCGRLIFACIRRAGYQIDYQLREVGFAEWHQMRGDIAKPPVCAIPTMITFNHMTCELLLWPAPINGLSLYVRYYPHIKEA
jgi:hypothetical protein